MIFKSKMFKKMYNRHFCEKSLVSLHQSKKQNRNLTTSCDNKKFLNLMNKTTRMVSDNYELSLVIRNDEITLQNNRYQSATKTKATNSKTTFCKTNSKETQHSAVNTRNLRRTYLKRTLQKIN